MLSQSSQTIIVAVVCSSTPIFFLVGFLCRHWARVPGKACRTLKHSNGTLHPPPTNNPAESDDSPIEYEEVVLQEHSASRQTIEVTENVAYGPIRYS